MKYRLVATDYDYTLANTPERPAERTKKVIREFKDKGGLFTIATGRMTRGILARMDGVEPNIPFSSYQGAVIYDKNKNKILTNWNIPTENALLLLDEFTECGYDYNAYINDELWIPREYPNTKAYCKANKIDFHLSKDLRKFIRDNGFTMPKTLLILPPDDAKKLEKYYSEKYKGIFTVTRSSPEYLEFTDFHASKGNSVKWIAEQLGIDRSEIICLGDSTNDISMIEYAGLGIAMGNAMDEVKAKADVVAKNCSDDGWTEIIEKYCL